MDDVTLPIKPTSTSPALYPTQLTALLMGMAKPMLKLNPKRIISRKFQTRRIKGLHNK